MEQRKTMLLAHAKWKRRNEVIQLIKDHAPNKVINLKDCNNRNKNKSSRMAFKHEEYDEIKKD